MLSSITSITTFAKSINTIYNYLTKDKTINDILMLIEMTDLKNKIVLAKITIDGIKKSNDFINDIIMSISIVIKNIERELLIIQSRHNYNNMNKTIIKYGFTNSYKKLEVNMRILCARYDTLLYLIKIL